MNNNSTLYVELDVHKESITVACAINSDPVELLGKIGTTPTDIERLCKRLQSKSSHVKVVYEAGPCSCGLYHRLVKFGFECMVCAPSLIPKKPGDRVKTDRRDAARLTRSLRAGDLSAVYVPGVEDEAFRDLARALTLLKREGKCPPEVEHRQIKYRHNAVECDHGRLKRIINATPGFKSMKTAYATIKGIKVMRALRKGQAESFYFGHPLGEMRLVARVFEM